MTAATVAAPDGPEDDWGDEAVLEHEPCRCGRLATVVLDADADTCWCSVTCPCGAFLPADADGAAR